MRERLTIAAVQPLIRSHDVAGNAGRHRDAILAAGADVVVFPELSLTGYELDAAALSTSDERLTPIVDACRATDSTALVGAPVAGMSGGRSIGMLAVDAGGAQIAYRKMWLGGDEPAQLVAGDAPAVLEVRGWRIGLAICKDTGVTAHAAATVSLGCDVYAGAVLETAADGAVQPRRARAIAARHGVWVAIASFAGSTGGGYASAAGGSAIWKPDGSVAARATSAAGDLAVATVSRDWSVPSVSGPKGVSK